MKQLNTRTDNTVTIPYLVAEQAIAKTVECSLLLDAYGALLSERQRQYLTLFYEEDLSLAEIAEQYDISRQAVHDAIRHGEAQLQAYEDALHLVARDRERSRAVQKLREITGNTSRINELLEQLL
jgi:uncharacterized protein